MSTPRFDTAVHAYGARIAPLSPVEVEYYARELRAAAFLKLVVGLVQKAKAAVARLEAWRRRQIAMAELMNLDDSMLRDIGLSRSEIPAAVDGKIFRPVQASNENMTVPQMRLVPRRAA